MGLSSFPSARSTLTEATAVGVTALVLLLTLVIVVARSMYRIRPYEVGVLTMFGSYKRLLHPGLNFASPLAGVTRVDLRSRQSPLGSWSVPVIRGQVRLTG